jgi:transketolase
VCVYEEHVAHGGVGAMLAQACLVEGLRIGSFRHLAAPASQKGVYGSQAFLRDQAGLGPSALARVVNEMVHDR